MKTLILFSLLVLTFSIACHKTNNSPYPFYGYYGTASMIVNGVNWQADKVQCLVLTDSLCYKNKVEIDLLKFSPEGFLRETYSFVKLIPEISNQRVYPINFNHSCNDTLYSTYLTTIDDGDVGKDFYNADTIGNNYLNIENYNSVTKDISGSFAVTYVFFNIDSTNIRTDTLRITNGKFTTKILN